MGKVEIDLGCVIGPQGPKGDKGDKGDTGESGKDGIAVKEGDKIVYDKKIIFKIIR